MKQSKPPVRIKRLRISPQKAAFFSIIVLCGCIGILAASIFLTARPAEVTADRTASEQSSAEKSFADNVPAKKGSELKSAAVPAEKAAPAKQPEKKAPATAEKAVSADAAVSKKAQDSSSVKPAVRKSTEPRAAATVPEKQPAQKSPAVPSAPAAPRTPSAYRGTVVIIFDDAGHNLQHLEPYLSIPFPVTISVLPGLPYSVQSAKNARSAGKEVMLHQPMQAKDLSLNPGPGAVTPDMNALEIERTIERNIAEISPVKGVNNHEGSLITESTWAVGSVLDVCSRNGLYFVDSRTSSESKAIPAAFERGMKIYERDVFIDNSPDKKAMRKEIERGLAIASKKGFVIMIGHVRPHGLAQLLTEMYPQMAEQGYVFKTISQTAP